MTVKHKKKGEKTYSNIDSIAPLPEEIPAPKAENPLISYEIDPAKDIPEGIPNWLQEIIKKSEEFKAGTGEDAATVDKEDLPF